jgi:hypothetical protein
MPIEQQETVRIEAPSAKVWVVYTDVERWPEWTPAMRKIERLEAGPLSLGSTARIDADRSPTSIWTVTEYTEGRAFTWETTARGVRIVAWHGLEPAGDATIATMGVRMSGLMASLFSPLLRSLARKNVRLEAEGLKRRVEGG